MKKWIILATFILASCAVQPNPQMEVLVENLEVPWAIAFLPDNSFLITERNTGNVYHYENGATKNVGNLKSKWTGEGGLLGITVDPEFEQNKYVYVYYLYDGKYENNLNRVSRFEYKNELKNEKIILDEIPGAELHNGGRIAFGPDNKLYITTGDAKIPSLSQDLSSTAGKILRINPDGSIPEDNPFPGSPVYSYGHRNPQGLAWHNGVLFAPEHGPIQDDEINIIKPGTNYGWPIVHCTSHEGYEPPIRCFSDWTMAPGGAAFDDKGNLYVAGLRGAQIRKFEIENGHVISEQVFLEDIGRIREIKYKDGYLYIATSNRDGRGLPRAGDDKVFRMKAQSST
jgi:glucose/arabinose dehydrogenase